MKLKSLFFVSAIMMATALVSCNKDNCACTARASNGEALYEVNGSQTCNDQVNTAQGEYCDCTCN